ncbi:MAG TPA: hypothetical protein DEQ34_14705 [Balneolaceae bacterium]|nr:hypothetical protein [Balneolaceae bacterium]|tara:strand:+ start:26911 stop:29079 length:2169 start_codon:yes stop_codon:yes gene_type:complete
MIALTGKILLVLAFLGGIISLPAYFFSAKNEESGFLKVANVLFTIKGLLVAGASAILIFLILNHRFDFYYVYNYTSRDLELRYLISAFWGGQEGSFLLWITFGELVGLGLMKWIRPSYRPHVLFFLTLNQVLLLSMVLGIHLGDIQIGASPFRSIAEAFPNAPFLQTNPEFIPADGRGLNDLLKSPWMVIHPPILFFGFALMAVPYCLAMAALWKNEMGSWIKHALPWTLGANLSLFIAIFLGGYWAYVTLSFGGYWAWDPVENASIIPWFIGVAGIHSMLLNKNKASAQKYPIIFAILAYAAVVYEAFLTRSGILGSSSVHSFTDLGLYNQLLIFLVIIIGSGFVLFILRYREFPKKDEPTTVLSREFLILAGSIVLFVIALVITLGTSSPLLGRLFVDNPTPPDISFYNQWSIPLAILTALLTVPAQYIFWRKLNAEALSGKMIAPSIGAILITILLVFEYKFTSLTYIIFVFSAVFALIGNGLILLDLIRKNVAVIGGTLSHVGFSILLIGFLTSSAFQKDLLDLRTNKYNAAIEKGEVLDEQGFPLSEKIGFLELRLNQPKSVNNKYQITYLGHFDSNQLSRPGQQTYEIRVDRVKGSEILSSYFLYPEVYPMKKRSDVSWSVDVDVKAGLSNDIYMYVAGSSYVEEMNSFYKTSANGAHSGLTVSVDEDPAKAWILLKAVEKPMVSLVWIGIFLIMTGFSISILRRRKQTQDITISG